MSKILVVDDERGIQESLSILLANDGHSTDAAYDGQEALHRLTQAHYDLVLSDIVMPRMDGLQLLTSINKQWGRQLPVIMFTAHASDENASQAKKGGALDLLIKPFDVRTLTDSIHKALAEVRETAWGQERGRLQQELENSSTDAIQALFAAVEAKDQFTLSHSARVACYALLLAKRLGLNETQLKQLEYLALLHDVGKIAVPENILRNHSPLEEPDETALQVHSLTGETILQPLRFIPEGGKVIRHHHERFDGLGYPDRLVGENIPLFSRIITIADQFDCLSSSCPNQGSGSQEWVIDKMIEGEGTLFDPVLLRLFLGAYCKLLMINKPS
jgi:putative nucleotidyltransferase with HDIG domain